MRKGYPFLTLLIFMTVTMGYGAVTGKVSGIIRDAETGDPLIGANVLIVGTSLGAATDMEGKYQIINIGNI